MSLFYKDLNTGKLRRTQANPVAVTKDGPLGIEGLRLEQPRTGNVVWIPKYLLVGAGHYSLSENKTETRNGL